MFDVKPVDKDGNLDLKKINRPTRILKLERLSLKTEPSKLRSAAVFYDVRQTTPCEDEARRFRRFIDEEKKMTSLKNKVASISVSENINTDHIVLVKNEKALLEKRLAEEKKLRLEKKIEFALAREQAERQAEMERRQDALLQVQLKKQQKIEEQKLKLLQKEKALEKIKQAKLAAKKQKKRKNKSHSNSVKNFFALFASKPEASFDQKDNPPKKRTVFSFVAMAACVFFLVFGVGFFYRSLRVKNLAIENGKIAYASLNEAKEGIKERNFDSAILKFNDAYDRFNTVQSDINSLGNVLVESSKFFPYLSKLSSGEQLSDAGKNISRIGVLATDILKTLNEIKNPLGSDEPIAYLKIFQNVDQNLTEIAIRMNDLQGNLDNINLEDIPAEQRNQFIDLKNKLPEINKFVSSFSEEEKVLTDVLGGNGPRKYLFLFQNNQEMRATGGFIGTYAVLDIADGNVRSFFVDGIFNPDGQLREKVIPPAPIQKISAAWSLHDSNWFPDFPVSAEKACWFYEKTGGPTVDGVITMTPTVMQRLLEITGPIEMSDYGVTIDKDNFMENIQTEVEINYDKEENQPKKILADLAPKILDRIFNAKNISDISKTMDVLLASLNEKHILIYSKNYNIETMLSNNGWSGEVLNTDKDYLSVINTNINGYKTDGVIDETIAHRAEIQTDGSIIDTVTITRHHNGGNTPYVWWNRVNADYMRVYVPKGSKLISVSGQTQEFDSPPIDYQALGFKHDAQVEMEEDGTIIDPQNGTRIYNESDKTVFANWIYVSPQESATMKYSYILPFKLDTNLTTKPADTYSLLAQKQSGSVSSKFSTDIIYPDFYKTIWKYPSENMTNFSTGEENKKGFELDSDLKIDRFVGVAFEKSNP
jgi:hypothetical protein